MNSLLLKTAVAALFPPDSVLLPITNPWPRQSTRSFLTALPVTPPMPISYIHHVPCLPGWSSSSVQRRTVTERRRSPDKQWRSVVGPGRKRDTPCEFVWDNGAISSYYDQFVRQCQCTRKLALTKGIQLLAELSILV